MAPFVVIYGVLFVYPTIKMVQLSFTDAPLIGAGQWVGLDNYRPALRRTACSRPRSGTRSISCCCRSSRARCSALVIALGRQPAQGLAAERRAGRLLPALHPAGLGRLPHLGLDVRQGLRRRAIRHRAVQRRPASLGLPHDPAVHAGGRLRHGLVDASASTCCCSSPDCATFRREIYEAAALDGAGRWTQFRRITWPLIWPVTVLVFTIQLILQLKIFDQVYLFAQGGRVDVNMVMVQYILQASLPAEQGRPRGAASLSCCSL